MDAGETSTTETFILSNKSGMDESEGDDDDDDTFPVLLVDECRSA